MSRPSSEGCVSDDEIDAMTDDEFWAHMLGDDDPCAPGRDWMCAVEVAIVTGSRQEWRR